MVEGVPPETYYPFGNAMPKHTYATCKDCRRHRNEVGVLTHSRLCMDCAIRRERENALSIHAKNGPAYLRQQVRTYLKARKALLDAGLLRS